MSNLATSLPPGFRFHPTDEELIVHYLRNRAASLPCAVSIIAEVDIYKFDPWELPAKSLFGEREWYFFSPRDRKYPNGVRPNRAAASGYWKATGTDKAIVASKGSENIGVKKALVFYKGRPPKGVKTDWIMHEYRLAEAHKSNNYRPMKLKDASMRLDDWVLCRIYRKSTHHATVDAEPEDLSVDDVVVPDPTTNAETKGNAFLKLPKSCSLTELLDAVDSSALTRLPENPLDMIGLENCPAGYPFTSQLFCSNNSFNNEMNYLVPLAAQAESPALITENSRKRQKPAESVHGGHLPRPSKKPMDSTELTDFTNRIDGARFNLMNHPFFNHHLVMNSHLGSQ